MGRALAPSQPRLVKIVAARKKTCAMSAKRSSIAQVKMVVALAAVNLAVVRAAPMEVVTYPTLWVLLGSFDFLIFWKLTLNRSLRAFHYTFLIVFVIAFVVMANFVATERLRPLGILVRWYQQLMGEKTNSISLGFIRIGEFWMDCFLTFTLACAIGLVATWLERRRDWDIAAFFRGALVGFGIANLLALIDGAALGWVVESPRTGRPRLPRRRQRPGPHRSELSIYKGRGCLQGQTRLGLGPHKLVSVRPDPIDRERLEPEPDAKVAKGHPRAYLKRELRPRNVLIAIEVSDNSLRREGTVKNRICAATGIPTYWIINLIVGCIEVYTEPTGPANGQNP
jgi:Putative restriction endonuclease